MKELLLHPVTRQRLADFTKTPSQASLLVGPAGSGKLTLAAKLSETILELPPGGLATYPYKLLIKPEGSTAIGIDTIRDLERFLSLRVPRQTAYNRAIIIENAQLLTLEAQNALLKTLEEPPTGTFIVLTADHDQALLPTLRSRAATITVKRPDRQLTETYFQARDFDPSATKQAYAISGGLPGLMSALLGQEEHPLLLATQRARQLLSQSAYERLLAVDDLAKQRPLALDVAFIFQQMAHVSLQTATGEAAAKWQAILKAGYQAAEALNVSAQPKLALTNLMLSF